jgi:hypothetical protein
MGTFRAQVGRFGEVGTVDHESSLPRLKPPAATQQERAVEARLFIDRTTGKGISVVRRQIEEGRERCNPGSKVRNPGNKRNNRPYKANREDNYNSSWRFKISGEPDPLPLDVQEP